MEKDIEERFERALNDCQEIIKMYDLDGFRSGLELTLLGFNELTMKAKKSAEDYLGNGKMENANTAAVYYEEVLKRIYHQRGIKKYASRMGKHLIGLIDQAHIDMNVIYLSLMP